MATMTQSEWCFVSGVGACVGCVGGASEVGAELESTSVLKYLRKVNEAIVSLDRDIARCTTAHEGDLPNSVVFPWVNFLTLDPPSPEEQAPEGWRAFFRDSSSLLDRAMHTDAIRKRAGEFERAWSDFYDKVEASGCKPSQSPKPELGPVPDVDAEPPEVALMGTVKTALLVAALLWGASLLLPILLAKGLSR